VETGTEEKRLVPLGFCGHSCKRLANTQLLSNFIDGKTLLTKFDNLLLLGEQGTWLGNVFVLILDPNHIAAIIWIKKQFATTTFLRRISA